MFLDVRLNTNCFIRLVSHQFIHAFVSLFQVKIKLLTIFKSLQINEILLPNEIHQFKVLKTGQFMHMLRMANCVTEIPINCTSFIAVHF